MLARIFQPARSAMTSGLANTQGWVLEFAAEARKSTDPLMGWTGSGDMRAQVRLEFESKEDAVAYAERHGLPFVVVDPHKRRPVIRPKGYGQNFATERKQAWTH